MPASIASPAPAPSHNKACFLLYQSVAPATFKSAFALLAPAPALFSLPPRNNAPAKVERLPSFLLEIILFVLARRTLPVAEFATVNILRPVARTPRFGFSPAYVFRDAAPRFRITLVASPRFLGFRDGFMASMVIAPASSLLFRRNDDVSAVKIPRNAAPLPKQKIG